MDILSPDITPDFMSFDKVKNQQAEKQFLHSTPFPHPLSSYWMNELSNIRASSYKLASIFYIHF
jgi:hypothetical protein